MWRALALLAALPLLPTCAEVARMCQDWPAGTITRCLLARISRVPKMAPTELSVEANSSLNPPTNATYARSAAWPSFQSHRMMRFRAAREQ